MSLNNLKLLKYQGFNNISYQIKAKEKKYVLRLFKSKKSVNISRKFEYQAQKKAYKKGFAAKPIFYSKEFMIYEYLKGIHKDVLEKKDIKNLAKIVKKLHKIELKTKSYNFEKDFKYYENILKDDKNLSIINKSKTIFKKLKKYEKDLVLSHFDLNPKNIIFKKDKIFIIDLEYAGTNDRFFDLATICVEFNFNKKMQKLFLNSYFKKSKKYYFLKLKLYKKLYKNICLLWFSSIDGNLSKGN